MTEATALAVELTSELLNERLEGYRVLREVGHGAMGIVFEARQRGLDRRVAVKVLPPNLSMRDRTVRRFLREAEAMGRLAHQNIVDVYEVGSRGSLHYFAMRFVDGPPLDVVLRAGVLGIGDVVQVGIDVSAALAHAHSRGVLHRDVKPSNLLRDGERVVLTDFGLAKPIDSDDEDAMTESGDLVGTPLYMSPEQIVGESDGIDARSDVWGLGATLYELLAGRPPFSGGSAQSILHAILHRDPLRLRRLRVDVPRDLEAVLIKCLEKDRSRRYSGAAGLHADLLAIQGGHPVSARPPRFFDPALRRARRHPVQTGAVLVALGVLGWFSTQLQSSKAKVRSADSARLAADKESKEANEDKAGAIARAELLDALTEWNDARTTARDERERERRRLHAFERVDDLLQVMKREQNLEMTLELTRVSARLSLELGVDVEALLGVGEQSWSRIDLQMRGAMLEGLNRFEEALEVHQRRARLYPRYADAWLDGARSLYKLALRDNAQGDGYSALRRLSQSVEHCDQALARAVRSRDEDFAATVLIERARSLIDLERLEQAEQNLQQAIDIDPARSDARALLEACGRASREEQAVEPAIAQAGGPAAAGAADARPASAPKPGTNPFKMIENLPLVGNVPESLEVERADLLKAGKNLTSIYRGLRDALRPAAGSGPAPAPARAAGSPAQAGEN